MKNSSPAVAGSRQVHSERRPLVGVVAALMAMTAAGVGFPLVNFPEFKILREGELMMVRGGVTALCFIGLFPSVRRVPSLRLVGSTFLLGGASFCAYRAFRTWVVGLCMITFMLSPLLHVAANRLRGESSSRRALVALVPLVGGVTIALQPWKNAAFSLSGFGWCMAAAFVYVTSFQVTSKVRLDPWQQTFWIGFMTAVVGGAICIIHGRAPFSHVVFSTAFARHLVVWGIVGGAVYYAGIVLNYAHLRTEVASVLMNGELPCVIMGGWLLLGERLTVIQLFGGATALICTVALGLLEIREHARSEHRERQKID